VLLETIGRMRSERPLALRYRDRTAETGGLPDAAVEGERGRTTVRLVCSHSYSIGAYLRTARHERPADRRPLPRPDLRMMQRHSARLRVLAVRTFLSLSPRWVATPAARWRRLSSRGQGHGAHPVPAKLSAMPIVAAWPTCMDGAFFSFVQRRRRAVG